MRIRTFKPQFAPLVKSGAKRQTIRPRPKHLPKVGDKECWAEWTGRPYWSVVRKLAEVELTEVRLVEINTFSTEGTIILCTPKRRLATLEEQEQIAHDDGFKTFAHLVWWFNAQYGEHFKGVLIRAKDL